MDNTVDKKGFFSDWTTFEKSWLAISSIVMLVLSIVMGDSPIGLVSGVTGIIGVVLAAKGKASTYLFASISVALYAWISYETRLWGDMMLNGAYYLPLNVVGYILWSKKKDDSGTVEAKALTKKGWLMVILGIIVGIVCLYPFLVNFKGNLPIFDAATTVIPIVAFALQILRYKDQWVLWISNNIISVTMWFILLKTGEGNISALLMYAAYLVNGIYGITNWSKLNKKEN